MVASAGTGARRSTARGVVLAAGDGAHEGTGHVSLTRVEAEAVGGPRGCRKRPKISTTVVRPPQHGHGASRAGGDAGSGGLAGGAAASRSRMRARLARRVALASRA